MGQCQHGTSAANPEWRKDERLATKGECSCSGSMNVTAKQDNPLWAECPDQAVTS